MIKALRTPDDRFDNLPDYPFEPHYADPTGQGLRMHYLDEGMRTGPVFLCLHGQPSWSYLYRKMIPVFAAAGRVIAPDLFGFGRSDKPVDEQAYSFDIHRDALLALIDLLDLTDITLVCQDWGGILGLTLPMARATRFSRLIVMNITLATGDQVFGPGFAAWQAFNRSQPDLDIAALMKRATPILSDAEAAAYAAPFPDARFKEGVRAFPDLVPATPDAPGAATSRAARNWWSSEWKGAAYMAIGMQDKVISPASMNHLARLIGQCPEPLQIEEACHFVQEWGAPIAEEALVYFR